MYQSQAPESLCQSNRITCLLQFAQAFLVQRSGLPVFPLQPIDLGQMPAIGPTIGVFKAFVIQLQSLFEGLLGFLVSLSICVDFAGQMIKLAQLVAVEPNSCIFNFLESFLQVACCGMVVAALEGHCRHTEVSPVTSQPFCSRCHVYLSAICVFLPVFNTPDWSQLHHALPLWQSSEMGICLNDRLPTAGHCWFRAERRPFRPLRSARRSRCCFVNCQQDWRDGAQREFWPGVFSFCLDGLFPLCRSTEQLWLIQVGIPSFGRIQSCKAK